MNNFFYLQILGPSSGWQPISLIEIITTNAVKKAYRKATLYVHPDKLQQRGASIQQKYICEKVFDLLKVHTDLLHQVIIISKSKLGQFNNIYNAVSKHMPEKEAYLYWR